MALDLDLRVAAVRRFNRFYTRRIGVLQEGLFESPFSLTEARVLYELAQGTAPTATELGRELALDPGYLSRILQSFERRRLIKKTPSTADGRQSLLRLTAQGRKAFAPLDARSRDEVRGLLGGLPAAQQGRLIDAMGTIGALLGEQAAGKASYLLRPHQPGDMGWVVHRHGVLYAQEYGYDVRFEALVAGIVARFVDHFDARRERCWIAEKDGLPVGCIFLVQRSKRVAQLRLLLVEPSARGLGIGARLVAECVGFARQAGYRSVRLWTQRGLDAARHVYEKAGFRLIEEMPHTSWGHKLVAQVWELRLPA